jgi:hypothetical protein
MPDLGLTPAQHRYERTLRALDSLNRRIDAGDSTVTGAAFAAAEADVSIAKRILDAATALADQRA